MEVRDEDEDLEDELAVLLLDVSLVCRLAIETADDDLLPGSSCNSFVGRKPEDCLLRREETID